MRFRGEKVTLKFTTYANNGVLAAVLFDEDDCQYGVITVNLEEQLKDKNCSFIDTNNMGDEIMDFLESNNLGTFTGRLEPSGFCVYPEFRFSEEALQKYETI